MTGSGSGVTLGVGADIGSLATGATYAVSISLADALPLARLETGVTWPATSKLALISDANESNASLFAAGFDSNDSTPFRYFVASPSPPVCCAIANSFKRRIGSAIS